MARHRHEPCRSGRRGRVEREHAAEWDRCAIECGWEQRRFLCRYGCKQDLRPEGGRRLAERRELDRANGANGNTVLNGSGAPSVSIGNNGDFYVDTTNSLIYGPKTSGAWGTGVSLKGSAGANGNTVLNGSGAPPSATGNNGDFYIDTTNHILYGPKAGGVWPGAGTNLVGPAGSNGNTVLNGSGAPPSATGNNGDFYIDTTNHILYGPKAAGVWPGAGTSLVGPAGATGGVTGVCAEEVTYTVTGAAGTVISVPITLPSSCNLNNGSYAVTIAVPAPADWNQTSNGVSWQLSNKTSGGFTATPTAQNSGLPVKTATANESITIDYIAVNYT